MSKRRMLYGYYIQQGEIAIVETGAIIVRRVFSLYTGGLSYQKISDLLNAEKIPYSQEMPVWNKHKVKRLLKPHSVNDGRVSILTHIAGIFQQTVDYIIVDLSGIKILCSFNR